MAPVLLPRLAICLSFLMLGHFAANATELRGHGGPVRAIAVTPGGATAITGSFDASAILWSLETGAARSVLRFHASQVNAVAALPGARFATAGEDGKVAIWGLAGGSPQKVLTGHAGPVASLALSPDSDGWPRRPGTGR
jgi:cytochrome c